MFGSFTDFINHQLAQVKVDGLFTEERQLLSPQDTGIKVGSVAN